MIENYGKGALIVEVPFDAPLVAAAPVVDFSVPFQLPAPPDTDQGMADCCVGEAWSKYHWQLEGAQYSVKSLFAYIAQSYGANIADGGSRLVNAGQETIAEAPDPNPKTPQNMRDKTGLHPALASQNEEVELVQLQHNDINTLAYTVKNFKGAVFGVILSNEGWQDMENPRPPLPGEKLEGHCIYAMGYHIHSDGQRCIIAASSWCNEVKLHHIRENYFTSGNTYIGFTVTKKGQFVPKKFVIQDGTKLGVMVLEGFTGAVTFADNEAHLQELKDAFGFSGSEPTIVVPQ